METSLSGNETLNNTTLNFTQQSYVSNTTLASTSLSAASSKEIRRTFNLKKLLLNAVYPEECSQNQQLTNASYIENHLSNQSIFNHTISNQSIIPNEVEEKINDNIFENETAVNEELVMNLTQPHHIPLNATCIVYF